LKKLLKKRIPLSEAEKQENREKIKKKQSLLLEIADLKEKLKEKEIELLKTKLKMERFKKERDALQSENDQLKEKADDFFLNLFNSPKHSSQIVISDGYDGGLSSNPLLVNR